MELLLKKTKSSCILNHTIYRRSAGSLSCARSHCCTWSHIQMRVRSFWWNEGGRRRERKTAEEVEEGNESKSWSDLNLVNCQRGGLPQQIPGENRDPSYLLALQPAANHLHLIVRHKLYEDQLGIWQQSLLCRWIGVPASRESTRGRSRHVTCALGHGDLAMGHILLNLWSNLELESGWISRPERCLLYKNIHAHSSAFMDKNRQLTNITTFNRLELLTWGQLGMKVL